LSENKEQLFEIIKILYSSKTAQHKNASYVKELCEMLHRESRAIKDDIQNFHSLEYVITEFISDVNQRLAYLTPKAMRVMDSSTPPKNYDDFIKMYANPETAFGEPIKFSDKESKLKRGVKLFDKSLIKIGIYSIAMLGLIALIGLVAMGLGIF